uniref:Putative secreted protein n=1 Tax=Anopheles darlingi TaxID=43151 RepID=A0A2M4DJC1_ANODA
MQRCVALCVAAVDVGAAFDQLLQYFVVRMQTRKVDRRLPVLILGVNVPVATLEQLRHYRVVAFLRCAVQQIRGSVAAYVVWWRITAAEHL